MAMREMTNCQINFWMGERVGQDIAHFQRFAELSVSARMKWDMGVLTAGRVQMKAWVEHSIRHNKIYN
jgi:hypothetical protein